MPSIVVHRKPYGVVRWLLLFLPLLAPACTGPAAQADRLQPTAPPAVPSTTPVGETPTAWLDPAAPVAQPTSTPLPTATSSPPTATPLPTADLSVCLAAGGRIERGSLRTDLLPHALEYRIYLPPCYDQQPDRHYPVLYLLHGQSYTDDQWDRLGVDETLDRLIARRDIAPFIVVMPRDRVWTQPSKDQFGQAVIERLIPFVDEFYRTLPDRRFRAIGGLSRGASWAVHLGISHWDLFGAIGAHSLPVFFEDVAYIDRWLEAIPPDQWPRLWLDIGDHDSKNLRTSTSWFEERLTQHGIPHEYYVFPGWHDETYWSSHVELYLRWYAREW